MEAVRNTWFGRLLTEGRALLLLLSLYLAAAAAVERWVLTDFIELFEEHPVWFWVLVAGPAAFILAFGTLPYAVRAWWRKRRAAIALEAPFTGSVRSYFRLDPYMSESPDEFYREDNAHQLVLGWLRQSRQPILFLSGASGAGKTSLLQGFILPKLRGDGWRVVEVRSLDDPLAELDRALAAPRPRGRKLLVVFDQFEEFVILEGRSATLQREQFIERVRAIQSNPNPGVCLLFAYRTDYQSQILSLKLEELRSGSTWTEVVPFDRSAARRFLSASPHRPSPELTGRMLDGADELDDTPGIYRPIILNMIGLVLQRSDQVFTDRPRRMVQKFLESAMAERPIHDVAPRVIEKLITSASTKQPRTVDELAAETHLSAFDILACLIRLEARGLTRRLGDSVQVWELSHDFVARQYSVLLGRFQWRHWQHIGAIATPVLFAAILVAAIVIVPVYLDYEAEHGIRELGGSLSANHGLVEAKFLDINDAALQTAVPILQEAKVQILDLSGAVNLTTLPVLDNLPALVEVDLDRTKVEDLNRLRHLTALENLSLQETKVHDLEPLHGLSALHNINLYKVGWVDLAPLKALPRLTSLDLGWVYLTDLRALESLKTLKSLVLAGTNVRGDLGPKRLDDVSQLAHLTALLSLDLSWTDVRNLAPLSGLTALQSLALKGAGANLDPLKNLTALKALDLEKANIDRNDIRGLLGALPGLQTLGLREVGFDDRDFAAVKQLKTLRRLDIAGTAISNLEPLSALPNLQRLDVSFIRTPRPLDLAPLKGLTALSYISVVGTSVEDLGSLETLPALRQIDCSTELLSEADITRLQQGRRSNGLPPVLTCSGNR
jgi:Leucine-rich repeat (LRR) protein